ncbi:MAG TPA: M28 family peptidase [Solirubrobacteraceae bacterium]|nr:M28 family peptidase [Solirubrobacteraceae bacterium]
MFNWRLYRATFVPVILALAIAAFSLSAWPAPYTSTLAPDAFNGARALAEAKSLAATHPDRRPGSAGDRALAEHVAQEIEALGGTASGGFSVSTRSLHAQTIDGERTLTTVIAQRPGSTDAAPIVILAHRDAAGRGAVAEVSGTAALLELARAFATRETRRTIILVSTSGGSGGAAGAADFVAHSRGPLDAAIVLGDVAGSRERKPFVVPYSDGFGSAPEQLQRTVAAALAQETAANPGAPSVIGQLAHLAFPLTAGEEGPLDARGLPAVLVQVSGEAGPAAGEAVSGERLEEFGRGVLGAVDALDTAPDVSGAMQTGVLIQHQTFPVWALRLLVASLLLGPLLLGIDALARLRRRHVPVGRWTLWTLACAFPFLLCALFACLIGWLGVVAAPAAPVLPSALPFEGAPARAVLACALVLALAWLCWPILVRRLGLEVRPGSQAAGLATLLVLVAVSLVLWAVDPFTALLLLPALHLFLFIVSPERRPRPPVALALVAVALAPLALLISFYADQLGLGPGEVAWTAVLLLAGGHLGILGALMWSLVLGCMTAGAILATTPAPAPTSVGSGDVTEITIRGPRSYAGPGSLGGTESALRR